MVCLLKWIRLSSPRNMHLILDHNDLIEAVSEEIIKPLYLLNG